MSISCQQYFLWASLLTPQHQLPRVLLATGGAARVAVQHVHTKKFGWPLMLMMLGTPRQLDGTVLILLVHRQLDKHAGAADICGMILAAGRHLVRLSLCSLVETVCVSAKRRRRGASDNRGTTGKT